MWLECCTVFELSGCGFKSCCSHINIENLGFLLIYIMERILFLTIKYKKIMKIK